MVACSRVLLAILMISFVRSDSEDVSWGGAGLSAPSLEYGNEDEEVCCLSVRLSVHF